MTETEDIDERVLTDPAYRAKFMKKLERTMARTEKNDAQIAEFKRDARMKLKDRFNDTFKSMADQVEIGRSINRRSEGVFSELTDISTSSDEYVEIIADIVFRHRSRYSKNDWLGIPQNHWKPGLRKLYETSAKAIDALDEVFTALRDIDGGSYEQTRMIIVAVSKLQNVKVPSSFRDGHGFSELIIMAQIRNLLGDLELCCIAAPVVLGEDRSGHTLRLRNYRPGTPYMAPAIDLINAWRALVGRKASAPKNQPRGKARRAATDFAADQPSTEFVRLGLLMIDDTLTPQTSASKAVTAIRRAQKDEPARFAATHRYRQLMNANQAKIKAS